MSIRCAIRVTVEADSQEQIDALVADICDVGLATGLVDIIHAVQQSHVGSTFIVTNELGLVASKRYDNLDEAARDLRTRILAGIPARVHEIRDVDIAEALDALVS